MIFHQTIIEAAELKPLLGKDNVVLLDCRRQRGVQHIQGAQLVHFGKDLKGKIIKGVTGRSPLPRIDTFVKKCCEWGIDATKQVIVYDENNGAFAARLWWMLQWLGHENVAVLNGGWDHWVAMKFPMTSGIIAPRRTDFQPKENRDMLVYRHDVEQMIKDKKDVLVDARAAERYRGEVEPVDPKAGHIPTAINLPHAENCDDQSLWKSKQAIEDRLAPIISDHHTTVMYCGSGVTACHNILAAKYVGMPAPKLYVGSWSGWIAKEL